MILLRRRELQVQEDCIEWTYRFGSHCTFHFSMFPCTRLDLQVAQHQLLPQSRLMLESMQWSQPMQSLKH